MFTSIIIIVYLYWACSSVPVALGGFNPILKNNQNIKLNSQLGHLLQITRVELLNIVETAT